MTQPPDPDRPPAIGHRQADHTDRRLGYASAHGYPDPVPTAFGWPPAGLFFAGLFGGFLLSVAVWGIATALTEKHSPGVGWLYAGCAVLLVKMTASVIFVSKPGWRLLGGGLLTSVALGFLTCGYAFVSAVCGPARPGP